MANLEVRAATLDDTGAINRLFRGRIGAWQRINAQGQVEDVAYDALSIYERWQHGGPWMSVETGAIWLSHLLRVNGISLVAVRDGAVVGYAEAHPGTEPHPFGEHLHLAELVADGSDLQSALLATLRDLARSRGLSQVTAAVSAYDRATLDTYFQANFEQLAQVARYSVRTGTGQGFYKAVDHEDTSATQIKGWGMPLGREQSARQHWAGLWYRLWDSVPEIAARQTYRLHFTASGFLTYVCVQQQLYDSRAVDVYVWSPRDLTPQWMTALRDWAHRQGYRTLTFAAGDAEVRALGGEMESLPYKQTVLGLRV